MKVQIPFYKYKIQTSQIYITNAFDWLYAKTCTYLNLVNNRAEYDCSDQAKQDTRKEIECILGNNIITKIEQNLTQDFLKKSINENNIENTLNSNGIFIYQDAVSGTVMPYESEMIQIISPESSECIKIPVVWQEKLKNTSEYDIQNIKKALMSHEMYSDPKDLKELQINVQYRDDKVIYHTIDIDIESGKLSVISPFTENIDWNNEWLHALRNSGNKDISDIINTLSAQISSDAPVNVIESVKADKYPRNAKLNKLYHLFKNLNDDELVQEIIEMDYSRCALTGFMSYCGKIMDRLAQKIKIAEHKFANEMEMRNTVFNDIMDVRENKDNLSCMVPLPNQTEYDEINFICGKIVKWDNRKNTHVFADNGQWLYVTIALYGGEIYDEVANMMNYRDFLYDACTLYKKRNSEVHIKKEDRLKDLTVTDIIQKFYNVCTFLYHLIKRQNQGE